MKVKVTATEFRVPKEVMPETGKVYEAAKERRPNGVDMYFIRVHGAQIGLTDDDCIVVDE